MNPLRFRLGARTLALWVLTGGLAFAIFGRPTNAQPAERSLGSRGKEVYDVRCVECHGALGKGDGPAAHLMMPRPRDFTLARYKIRSTETGSLSTDDDLQRSVRQGLYGSAMPAWQKICLTTTFARSSRR